MRPNSFIYTATKQLTGILYLVIWGSLLFAILNLPITSLIVLHLHAFKFTLWICISSLKPIQMRSEFLVKLEMKLLLMNQPVTSAILVRCSYLQLTTVLLPKVNFRITNGRMHCQLINMPGATDVMWTLTHI